MLNISWSCRDHFHRNVNAEIFLIFVPSVLTLTAVCLVSVYVLKIQIKLKKEIPPTVNLPTISGALAQGTQSMAAIHIEERNNLWLSIDVYVQMPDPIGIILGPC